MSEPILTANPFRRYRHVLGEGSWALIGSAAVAVGMVVGTRIITQVVHPNAWGQFNLILGAVYLLRSVFFQPIYSASIRFYSEVPDQPGLLRSVCMDILRRRLMLVTIAILAGGAIWAWTGHFSYLSFPILALFIAFDTPRSLDLCILQAARKQRPFAINRMAEAFLRPLIIVGLVYLIGATVLMLVSAQLLLGIAAWVMAVWAIRRQFAGIYSPDTNIDGKLSSGIRAYALPLIPMAVLAWVTGLSDRFIVGGMVDLTATGIYATIYGLTTQPFLMAQGVLAQTLSPIYYAAASRNDQVQARRVIRMWALAMFGINALGVLAIWLLHNLLTRLLVGPEYQIGASLMTPIAIGAAFYAMLAVFETRLYARKRTDRLLISNAITAVASLIAVPILVHRYGMIGAAYAAPIYFGVGLVVTFWLGNRE